MTKHDNIFDKNILFNYGLIVNKVESAFVQTVWNYYAVNRREMPWRADTRGYYVLLSEIMLQQTQVTRVIELFTKFIERFPDFETLASADLGEVLRCWQGLGYNRRAKFLHETAKIIVEKYNGVVPKSVEVVDDLPGIGQATAAAIVTYTYNISTPFIETNIRRVYLHHFFVDQLDISDGQLLLIIEKTWSCDNPREWGWALMDYGSYLAKIIPNPNRNSRHYTKQSKFVSSVRQMRGVILKKMLEQGKNADWGDLALDSRFAKAYQDLKSEKLI